MLWVWVWVWVISVEKAGRVPELVDALQTIGNLAKGVQLSFSSSPFGGSESSLEGGAKADAAPGWGAGCHLHPSQGLLQARGLCW